MMHDDYKNIAEYYDYMLVKNPERESFFKEVFLKYKVKTILDCACGTGNDLLLFKSLGYEIVGSDISDSMLQVAEKRITGAGESIFIKKADFHFLEKAFDSKFDVIVCLSNAINEEEVDPVEALNSMQRVLNNNGIIIFDQGQTDFTMKNPPKYFPEVNDRYFSRLFTMSYEEKIMTVNIFDFLHKEEQYDFRHSEFKIWLRMMSDWEKIMDQTKLNATFYGNWDFEPYNKERVNGLSLLLNLIRDATTYRCKSC